MERTAAKRLAGYVSAFAPQPVGNPPTEQNAEHTPGPDDTASRRKLVRSQRLPWRDIRLHETGHRAERGWAPYGQPLPRIDACGWIRMPLQPEYMRYCALVCAIERPNHAIRRCAFILVRRMRRAEGQALEQSAASGAGSCKDDTDAYRPLEWTATLPFAARWGQHLHPACDGLLAPWRDGLSMPGAPP